MNVCWAELYTFVLSKKYNRLLVSGLGITPGNMILCDVETVPFTGAQQNAHLETLARNAGVGPKPLTLFYSHFAITSLAPKFTQ